MEKQIDGVDVHPYDGAGYKPMMAYGAWRVAYLTHAERFEEANFSRLERHRQTDEVFVLLEGEAELVIGERLERVQMERGLIYNVLKDTWHGVITTPGAKMLIVENDDVSQANSEYQYVKLGAK